MALAVFTKLAGFAGRADEFVRDAKRKLLSKIKLLQRSNFDDLTPEERTLLTRESAIDALEQNASGIKCFEKMFPSIASFLSSPKIDPLSSAETVSILTDGNLSALVKAIGDFKWTGGSNKAPMGKSESIVGISDSLLNQLMDGLGAGALLTSWLRSGDSFWKRWVDSEIESRKREIRKIRLKDPKSGTIRTLESEIDRLGKDWKL